MSWTDERIDELTQLWQQGLSASEIGKRLGVSKNAVVGKAHRLKLPARPSPIKRESKRAAVKTAASGTGKASKTKSKPAQAETPASGKAELAGKAASSAASESKVAASQAVKPAASQAATPQADAIGAAEAASEAKSVETRPVKPAVKSAAKPAAKPAGKAPSASSEGEAEESRPATVQTRPKPRASRSSALRPPMRVAMVATSCLWPIGDPGDPDFHFCGEPSVPGKPYCAEHCARAYITRSRDQRNNEAA